jgi:hypothetical protein
MEGEAQKQPKYRKLRIAWSVGWALMAVLLVALWVRSYWWVDAIMGNLPNTTLFTAVSTHGKILSIFVKGEVPRWGVNSRRTPEQPFSWAQLPRGASAWEIDLPHFGVALICGVIGLAPWLHRFSLRTLLIGMTLVAVVLGILAISN